MHERLEVARVLSTLVPSPPSAGERVRVRWSDLRNVDCGLRNSDAIPIRTLFNPQSAIRNPQSTSPLTLALSTDQNVGRGDRILFASIFLLLTTLPATAEDASPPTGGVLHLTNGSFLPGGLQPSAQATTLRWQSPHFARPFDFPLAAVNAAHYPTPKERPQPGGEYCFELVAGDVLFGELRNLTEEHVELESARLGRVQLKRDQIQRLYRWKTGADLVYVGPNGLLGWKESTGGAWREEGGHLTTDKEGTHIRGDFGIPPQAAIEFEISWKKKPDFVFAVGVSDSDDELIYKRSYRFEIWDEELVVRCELGREADVDSVDAVGAAAGRAHYVAYLDQMQGRLLIYSPSGGKRAELNLTPRNPKSYSGLRLTNKRGDVRLERLRITRWNGRDSHADEPDKSRVASNWAAIHRSDGQMVHGDLVGFDGAAQKFRVRTDAGDTQVPADQVASVYLSPQKDVASREVRVVYQDGERLSGGLVRIDQQKLALVHPGIAGELALPLERLQALVGLQEKVTPQVVKVDGRSGRLELEGSKVLGRLTDGREQPDASCLVWHPDLSHVGSPLKPGVEGRIVYRDAPPPMPKPVAQPQVRRQQGILEVFVKGLASQPAQAPGPTGRALHLRSGDTIPCEVSRIDEDGVTFKTPLSDATFVPHDRIKALELINGVAPPRLAQVKRDRLLTLPRLQRDTPPTHLIRSENGDFLRGRVVAMDAAMLTVEVRLENKDIPRSRVAQIIWLHADELGDPDSAEKPGISEDAGLLHGTRVQGLDRQGIRLTFFAEELSGKTLSGTSDVLGASRIDLEQIDQLLFGAAIEKAAAELAYHQWKLHYAVEPKIAMDLPGGGDGGTESALVGKPAPDFQLDLLDGGRFKLSEAKGQVVVLDFWATWCGPCLQAMPVVEEVVAEFRDQGVRLIAVNLEEPANQIRDTMERHKLAMTVALDRDGVAAARYEAVAIPQTVIVDREGNVARLFVGGGPHLAEQLREALRAVLTGETETP